MLKSKNYYTFNIAVMIMVVAYLAFLFIPFFQFGYRNARYEEVEGTFSILNISWLNTGALHNKCAEIFGNKKFIINPVVDVFVFGFILAVVELVLCMFKAKSLINQIVGLVFGLVNVIGLPINKIFWRDDLVKADATWLRYAILAVAALALVLVILRTIIYMPEYIANKKTKQKRF